MTVYKTRFLVGCYNYVSSSTQPLLAARARGRKGGRKFQLSKTQVRMAQAAMKNRDTSVAALCQELGVTRSTLYRYVSPVGELRERSIKLLNP